MPLKVVRIILTISSAEQRAAETSLLEIVRLVTEVFAAPLQGPESANRI